MDIERELEEKIQGGEALAQKLSEASEDAAEHLYLQWARSCTQEESKLQDRALDLDAECFADIRFDEPICDDNGMPLTSPIDGSPLDGFRFLIDPAMDDCGTCQAKLRTITLHPDHLDDATLVHEILHVYDEFLASNPVYRDFWVTRLYSRLRTRLEDIDGLCALNITQDVLSHDGGHSIFFMLKAYDLDLRLGLSPGTVFGYQDWAPYITDAAVEGQN
ncbi:MAG: hypothetical protein HY914_14535 [Desulfomonile tiedjei]|nr:hypothetical protein [Desulfomonile tiedjei]